MHVLMTPASFGRTELEDFSWSFQPLERRDFRSFLPPSPSEGAINWLFMPGSRMSDGVGVKESLCSLQSTLCANALPNDLVLVEVHTQAGCARGVTRQRLALGRCCLGGGKTFPRRPLLI